MIKKQYFLGALSVMVCGLIVLMLSPARIFAAIPQEDIRAINLNTVWHKTYKPATCSSTGPVTSNGNISQNIVPGEPGSMFMIGDSIGTQVAPKVMSTLRSSNWQLDADVKSGRTLPEAIEVVAEASDRIQGANVVVVQIGTNSAGFNPENVNILIDQIRTIKPDVPIFWVDTVVVDRPDYAQSLNAVNGIIYAQSAQKNFGVLSWNKKVFGDGADPMNINPTANDNGYIRRADQFVHLSDTGEVAMTELISSLVLGDSNKTGSCPDGSAPACLVGSENDEKVWNYFLSRGLDPLQTAGLMGNLAVESSFDPFNQENSQSWESGGWGLAQWTAGRRITLKDAVISSLGSQYYVPTEEAGELIGTSDEDKLLIFQLDFLVNESSSRSVRDEPNSSFPQPPPGTIEWEGFKTMQSVEHAMLYWEWNFERAGVPALGARLDAATRLLEKYGSLTAPTGGC